MSALTTAQIYKALGLEGPGVNVFKPRNRKFFHVFFRHRGSQINRSTGKETRSEAKEVAAKILSDVVSGTEDQQAKIDLRRLVDELNEIKAAFQNQGAVVAPATTGNGTPSSAPKTRLVDAYTEFLAAKKIGVSEEHYDDLRIRCLRFVNYCASVGIEFVQDVTSKTCLAWVKSVPVLPKTERGYLGNLSSFLNWCTMEPRLWLPLNPVKAVPRERVKAGKLPDILKPDMAAAVMNYVEENKPEFAAFYAISLFAGVRGGKRHGELRSEIATYVEDDEHNIAIGMGLVEIALSGPAGYHAIRALKDSKLCAMLRRRGSDLPKVKAAILIASEAGRAGRVRARLEASGSRREEPNAILEISAVQGRLRQRAGSPTNARWASIGVDVVSGKRGGVAVGEGSNRNVSRNGFVDGWSTCQLQWH